MIGRENSDGDVSSHGNNSNQNDTNEAGCGKLVVYFVHSFFNTNFIIYERFVVYPGVY